jgi:glycosyltransferase involved in cell wall biosynthesis
MRILHVITSLGTGGAEIMLQKVVRALPPARYASSVISLTSTAPVGDEMREEGIPVVALRGHAGVLTPAQIRRLIRAYRSVDPDVVHAWMYHANLASQFLVRMCTRSARPGLIVSVRGAVHAPTEQKPMSRVIRRIDAALSGGADAIVFNSYRSAEQHVALGYHKQAVTVIPNGFDIERFESLPLERARIRAELGCGDRFLVGLVARFDRLKGHRIFLEAAGHVAHDLPECRFLLAGRGCDDGNGRLRQWVAEFGLAGKVFLLGERRDVASIDNALDLAVCSSISESFPNAIGEAMACAVPAVVTDVGDCPRLVGDTGRVIPPQNPSALAEAIRAFANLPAGERTTLGASARQRIVKEFSTERVVHEFEALYERCARRQQINAA